jgi:hypothetical protein
MLHHPVIAHRSDGRWMVTCPECAIDRNSTVPIGIGLPLGSHHLAELLCENHAGRRAWRRSEPTSGGR